ncbi:hypothetical protein AB4407_11725 [Vibrio sp. 10N.261.46.E11]
MKNIPLAQAKKNKKTSHTMYEVYSVETQSKTSKTVIDSLYYLLVLSA